MRPGDVVTHCFQGNGDCIVDVNGAGYPDAWAAREDGIIFDVGHGGGSFNFEVAQTCDGAGIPLRCHQYRPALQQYQRSCLRSPTTLSKFLNLGLSIEEVIEKSTIAAAKAIGREEELGHLKIGTIADIAVFDVIEGEFESFRHTRLQWLLLTGSYKQI